MDFLTLFFITELSMADLNYIGYDYKDYKLDENYTYFLTFKTEIDIYETFYFSVLIKSNAYKNKNEFIGFFPTEITNIAEAGIKYKMFNLFFRHLCLHPEVPWGAFTNLNSSGNMSYNEIGLKIEVKLKVE